MLGRILIIMGLVGIGLWLLKKLLGARNLPSSSRDDSSQGKLVACAHCGTRLPATEALWKEGQGYCSMTHRNLGPKKK